MKIVFTGGEKVDYQWNDTLQGWARFQAGTPHVDVDGHQIAPQNLVVLFTPVQGEPGRPARPRPRRSAAATRGCSPTARSSRAPGTDPTRRSRPRLTDGNGQPILLTPGHTWVALPQAGSATIVPPGQDVVTFHG